MNIGYFIFLMINFLDINTVCVIETYLNILIYSNMFQFDKQFILPC